MTVEELIATKFVVVAPSGNTGSATFRHGAGYLGVQILWETHPTDEDKSFFERALFSIIPPPAFGYITADAGSKEESDRQLNQFISVGSN